MPVEIALWKLEEGPEKVTFSTMDSEALLEDTLARDLSVLDPALLLIGRQVATDYGKFLDLLAMDPEGRLVVIELKRNRTPRDAVAQLLDYASWVDALTHEEISYLYAEKNGGLELEEGFDERFGASLPETLNESHRLILVSSELDPSSERILQYLGETYGVPINAVFFRYFEDGERKYLARSWLIDPKEAEGRDRQIQKREPWNGRDFYVSLGGSEGGSEKRTWEDCRRYGFISGGGGKFYSQTLRHLEPGHRVFVNVPGQGFVGVGEVTGTSTPVTEFTVRVDGQEVPILEAPTKAENLDEHKDDPERCEYMVPVRWIETVSLEDAYWVKGLFASQHTACKLRNQFTIERLVKRFGLEE